MEKIQNWPHFGHKIYLIRHGETEWSKTMRHTGKTDIELTANGQNQAHFLKKRFENTEFSQVFVSPLKRAQKTAEIAGFLKKAQITPLLSEWNYGDYEGLKTVEIQKGRPDWNLFKDGVVNGESISQVASRADQAIELASEVAGDVAFFSSGHICRIIGARWLGLNPQVAQLLALSTASVSILSYEHEWRVLELWNDCSHFK